MNPTRTPAAEVATAVILCGGEGRRFGGDKVAADLAGLTVLDRLILALPAPWPVVCVGPVRPTARPVVWVSEDPTGGGPLAGVAAGFTAARTELAVVIAGDMPLAAPAALALLAALVDHPELTAVVAQDDTGHRNPLLAAYRVRPALAHIADSGHDRAAKTLLQVAHQWREVDPWAGRDIDTVGDLADIAAEVRRRGETCGS